jgi:DNA (cytosine-5)-methyltransferase 1
MKNMKDMLKVVTLFSGYDSQCLALRRLGVEYELVAWAEIDRWASRAHDVLFPEWKGRNVGDVCEVDWRTVRLRARGEVDLLTYSSPCQDFSNAGLQRGGAKGSGTRSSLLWECERAIAELRPRYLLMENVAGLVQQKFIGLFNEWQGVLSRMGYRNYAEVLNAKCYGVPQNRERVFMVSVREDCEPGHYYFPLPFKLERRLKDVLEGDVAERYYLGEERVKNLQISTDKEKDEGRDMLFEPKDGTEEYANSVTTNAGGRKTDNFIAEPVVDVLGAYDESQNARVVGLEGVSPAVINGHKDGVPKVAVLAQVRTEEGKAVRREHKGDVGVPYGIKGYEPRADGLSNTVTCVAKDNLLAEEVIQVGNMVEEAGYSNPVTGRVYSGEGVAPCCNSMQGEGRVPKVLQEKVDTAESGCGDRGVVLMRGRLWWVRRLTERELFRLMDLEEGDIDLLLGSGISNTQLAKMAGNSIVVSCLYWIFYKLLVDVGNPTGQRTIFDI